MSPIRMVRMPCPGKPEHQDAGDEQNATEEIFQNQSDPANRRMLMGEAAIFVTVGEEVVRSHPRYHHRQDENGDHEGGYRERTQPPENLLVVLEPVPASVSGGDDGLSNTTGLVCKWGEGGCPGLPTFLIEQPLPERFRCVGLGPGVVAGFGIDRQPGVAVAVFRQGIDHALGLGRQTLRCPCRRETPTREDVECVW